MSNKLFKMKGFSKNKFIVWIRSKNPEDIVGTTTLVNSCPIATFMKEELNCPNPSVGWKLTCNWRKERTHVRKNSPLWVARFMKRVDSLGTQKPVTQKQALDIIPYI